MLNGHPFSLCRALSEVKPKAELSASQFGTLNECELKAKQEFSERNKQSLVQKLYWRFLGIESGYRKRKWNKISRELDRCGYRAEKLIIIPV